MTGLIQPLIEFIIFHTAFRYVHTCAKQCEIPKGKALNKRKLKLVFDKVENIKVHKSETQLEITYKSKYKKSLAPAFVIASLLNLIFIFLFSATILTGDSIESFFLIITSSPTLSIIFFATILANYVTIAIHLNTCIIKIDSQYLTVKSRPYPLPLLSFKIHRHHLKQLTIKEVLDDHPNSVLSYSIYHGNQVLVSDINQHIQACKIEGEIEAFLQINDDTKYDEVYN